MSTFERATEAVAFLTKDLPEALKKPQVAIVCGSGLGGLAETVQAEPRAEFDYTSIPHFPRPTGIFCHFSFVLFFFLLCFLWLLDDQC